MDVARAVLDGDVAALDEVVEQFYGGDSGKVRRIERANERIGTERARKRARDAPRRDRRRGRTMGRRWTGRERARARGGTKGGGGSMRSTTRERRRGAKARRRGVDGATRDARREGRTRGRENARIGTSDENLRTDEDGSTRRRQRAEAEKILQSLQEHEQTWTRVDGILETSKNANTKFFALQVLDGVIKYRWGLLPNDQREGIKNFVSNLIIKLSADETTFRRDRAYINKINNVLVQILKHDWPHRWQSFIPDLVGAARTSESLCENCMSILKLLSEEVFDFSRGEMTQDKIRALKTSLNSEFKMIHELCEFVLTHSQKPELIKTTLTTLNAFLSWIPLGYIFESSLLDTLLALAPNPAYRNIAFLCLSEIGGLNVEAKYDAHFIKLYTVAVEHLLGILPRGVNIAQAYANGTDDEQAFVQNLGIFLTQFFKAHIVLLESTAELQQSMLIGIEYLLNISYVEEPEVFKVCLDYWHFMVCDVFQSEGGDAGDFRFGGDVVAQNERGVNRRVLYAAPFSKLRLLMISRMAKPEEVLIVEDENGNIVRETLKDNDVLVQYKIMRETLIYLAHLDHKDTETQMLEKLHAQLNLSLIHISEPTRPY